MKKDNIYDNCAKAYELASYGQIANPNVEFKHVNKAFEESYWSKQIIRDDMRDFVKAYRNSIEEGIVKELEEYFEL